MGRLRPTYGCAAAAAVVAGYGDQRGLELSVSAGLSPEQALAIATSNGARFLNDRTVGTIAQGMQADLVVLKGNPSHDISDVRNVELVFKGGVAYDPERLVAAAAGTLGELTIGSLFTWPVISFLIVLAVLTARRATRIHRRHRPALAAEDALRRKPICLLPHLTQPPGLQDHVTAVPASTVVAL
jgi:hypothetical protein